MEYETLVSFYERIEATTKRLEMTDLLVQLFHQVPPEDIKEVAYLTEGANAPDYAGIELGLADKLAIRVLAQVTGLENLAVEAMAKEKGDLGLVAADAIAGRGQAAITATEPLTVRRVFENLTAIANASGEGSQQAKIDRLSELPRDPAPDEAKNILRTAV